MNKFIASPGHDRQIYVAAFITSIFLSFLIDYRNPVINPDGICYLLSAQVMGTESIRDAMHLCPQARWPFYSLIIYAFGQISHLSYTVSAHLLNGFFSLISVMTFIMIVKEAGGTRRILWLAALVILFNHQFNALRDNIVRDHGFWAFYLVSIYLLLKYFREPKWTTALAWNASLVMATLFRVEGVIFLVTMPFISWLYLSLSLKQRAKSFLTLNLPLILICMALALWQLFHPQQTTQQLGRIGEVINQIHNGLFILADRYQSSKAALIQYVLPHESAPDTGAVLIITWVGWYLYNFVLTFSGAYTLLLIYAWMNRAAVFSSRSSAVLWGYLGVNLIMTLGFLAEQLFISKRYLIALSLVCMIWIPFALNDLINKWTSLRHRIFLLGMTLFLFISALSGIIEFGPSKIHIRSAGDWIAGNVPANASLYVNDFQLLYYTQHFGAHLFDVLPAYLQKNVITQGKWKQYDYLALRLGNTEKGETAELKQELAGMTPVQVFSNERGNRVVIYKTS